MMISKPTPLGWFWGLNAENPVRAALRPAFLILFLLFSCLAFAQEPPVHANPADEGYRLGPGDHVFINVHNQDDLSGEYVLDGTGRFSMPLIGTVAANGLTAVGLEEILVYRLKPDYLVNPRVSVRVESYRPFYILGEVENPGSFGYVQGMSYLTAVAIAGGFTYRAKKDVVFVIRGDDPDREEVKTDIDEKVQPGDIIRVAERLF